jgi:CRP/FNR family transcriptional regulator, cyclic AMP receptor protein
MNWTRDASGIAPDAPAVDGRTREAQAVLVDAEIFRGVEAGRLAALTDHLRLVEFACGEVIYTQNEESSSFYCIISGKVKIGRCSPDGREKLLAIMGPSDMFGELSIIDPSPRTSTATAITHVCAMSADPHTLRAWIREDPEFVDGLLRVLAKRLRHTNSCLTDLISTDGPGRVAKQLLRLAQRFGVHEDGALRVTHDLTQNEIAQLVGASRETVNKTLANFVNRGWIRVDGKSVVITEPERLARRAR